LNFLKFCRMQSTKRLASQCFLDRIAKRFVATKRPVSVGHAIFGKDAWMRFSPVSPSWNIHDDGMSFPRGGGVYLQFNPKLDGKFENRKFNADDGSRRNPYLMFLHPNEVSRIVMNDAFTRKRFELKRKGDPNMNLLAKKLTIEPYPRLEAGPKSRSYNRTYQSWKYDVDGLTSLEVDVKLEEWYTLRLCLEYCLPHLLGYDKAMHEGNWIDGQHFKAGEDRLELAKHV